MVFTPLVMVSFRENNVNVLKYVPKTLRRGPKCQLINGHCLRLQFPVFLYKKAVTWSVWPLSE